MNLVYQSAFLKALGWSLLDSLWQMGVLWLLFVWLTGNGRKLQSRQRHTIALLSLAGGSVWFLITLVVNFYQAAAAATVVTVYEGTPVTASLFSRASSLVEFILPFLSIIYLVIACILFVRFYHQYTSTKRLTNTGITKASPELRVFLQQAAAHIGITKKVTIWLSSVVDAPLTLGFWKPVILLPIAAINHLNIQQTEAIILHELHHIKRNDYLINLLIACADVVLFFNPFSRLLTEHIRKEREHSCDDLVLQFRYDAALYVKSLLVLEQNRTEAGHLLAVAATGKDKQLLLNRVKRILYNEQVSIPVNQKFIAYLLSAVLIGFIGWYNPGNVIVKTISAVKKPMPTTEYTASFRTPDSDITRKQQPAAGNVQKPCKKKIREEETLNLTRAMALQQLIDQATDEQLEALIEEHMAASPIAEFVSNTEERDFSLPTVKQVQVSHAASAEVQPFVPSNSFSFQLVEDTTLPKRYIATQSEIKAKEAMEKALKALQEVNWQKLEKELGAAGKQVDIIRLQNELKKAFKEVNWNKINDEVQSNLKTAVDEISQEQNAWRLKLESYQHARLKKQATFQQMQEEIIQQRLQENRKATNKKTVSECTEEKKVVKAKKIVVI